MAIDVRELRDNQVPDVEGRTIPLDVARGQFWWSVVRTQEREDTNYLEDLALIGRVEQAQMRQGLSSSYACLSCCADSYSSGWVSPVLAEAEAGETTHFTAYQEFITCYGDTYTLPRGAYWTSSDTDVATIDSSSGEATAQNGGETVITAIWTAHRYYDDPCAVAEPTDAANGPLPSRPPCATCRVSSVQVARAATQRVRPRITSVSPVRGVVGSTVGVTINGLGPAPSVSAGDGISVGNIAVNSARTRITAEFVIAENAAGGSRRVVVTVRGEQARTTSPSSFRFQASLCAPMLQQRPMA